MSTVEVLAPLRIETRFYPPGAGRAQWLLRLRVWPDEFSMARQPPPPSAPELDLLDEALQTYPDDAGAQLHALAARLGMERALWLRRVVAVDAGTEPARADRGAGQLRDPDDYPDIHQPYGLPPALQVWLLHAGAAVPTLAGTMRPDLARIAADLGLAAFEGPAAAGELPQTWWTSFPTALAAGLAIEIPLAAAADGRPAPLEALVVSGLGDLSPAPLMSMHAESGRLAVLAQGAPTNTVDGEATAGSAIDPASAPGHDDPPPDESSASAAVMRAVCGPSAAPLRLRGGDVAAIGHDRTVVRALWPVLWGHALRDVCGMGAAEARLADWARDHLAPQGPYPAIRVGQQPYGLLPATLLADWIGTGPDAATAARIRAWAMPWRDAAAVQAAAWPGTVVDATAAQAAALVGLDAPTRWWALRPVATQPVVNALRAQRGLPPLAASAWDVDTARALAGAGAPLQPLAPFMRPVPLPASTREADADDPDTLRALLEEDGEAFPYRWQRRLGLLGHLVFETLCLLRATVGAARAAIGAGQPVDPDAPLPLHAGEAALAALVQRGHAGSAANPRLNDLFAGDAGAQQVAKRCLTGLEALTELVQAYAADPAAVMGCVLAALDTASHRVDPWINGLADARLRQLDAAGAPWRLGAYGWVDSPAPHDPANPAHGLPPGPTAAGLLHAPSQAQAMTAALLRDAAVRDPADTRWHMRIDSASVRAAVRLAERVRGGVHPYEALGLEVERVIGDWDTVRALRQQFPLRDTHAGQRCCDGARVLRLLFRPQPGDAPAPVLAALPAAVRAALAVCDTALDTYADLLVADGIHALVCGQGGVGHAAMEAAAGLGAPPELRAMRTPRHADNVRVSAWALLPAGPAPAATAAPALAADPAFGALLDDQLGRASTWTWSVAGETVSLADRGLHGAEALSLSAEALAARLRSSADAALPVLPLTGAAKLAHAARLAALLGGGDANPPVPGESDGRDDDSTPPTPLRGAMLDDLSARLATLRTRLQDTLALINGVDLDDPVASAWGVAQCHAWQAVQPDDAQPLAQARSRLQARLALVPGAGVNGLRQAIRQLAGCARLPVLPRVPRSVAGAMVVNDNDDEDRPAADRSWLEIVAAVRPRLALLEALQLDPPRASWHAAVRTPAGNADPWHPAGPVVVAYGPDTGVLAGHARAGTQVAIAALDAWQDAIPSDQHLTSAAFGFNGPKSRAPQAVLLAVPPDPRQRLSDLQLAALVLETRQLARARGQRPRPGQHVATPSALSSLPSMFWQHWT